MLANGGGSIIVISSYTGTAGVPNFPPAYQSSKAAVVNIARGLAVSWGDRGVRVNAISPGWFPSEMTDAILAAPVWRSRIEAQAALGRTGDPEELTGALLLLASDAGSYITGANIPVDGGTSASVGHSPYTEELFGLHAMVMPHGLGERVVPSVSPHPGRPRDRAPAPLKARPPPADAGGGSRAATGRTSRAEPGSRRDRMAASRPRRGQDGFTYMEVLIAIVILGVVALGLAQGMMKASGALAASKVNGNASAIAISELDRVRGLPYKDIGTVGGYPAGTIAPARTVSRDGVTFAVAVTVEFVDDPTPGQVATGANYKRVRVTVTPPSRPGAVPATQTTLVAPPTIGAVAEKARIIATITDAITGEPVAGALVKQSGGASPSGTVTTDADGTASFAALEPSGADQPYTLSVDEPGYVLVSGTTTSKSLVASETWRPTLSVFRPATIVVRLTDALTGALVTDAAQVSITPPGGTPEPFTTKSGTITVDRLAGDVIRGSTTQAFVIQVATECHVTPDPVDRILPAGYPAETTETITVPLTRLEVGRVDATVIDRITGAALPGATVRLSGGGPALAPADRITDANGLARYCAPPSGDAPYDLVAGLSGYGPAQLQVVVERDVTTAPTLALIPSTTSVVRLLAEPGRSARLERSGYTTLTMTTDAAGRAEFAGVPPGTWQASVADETGLIWMPLGGKAVEAVGGELREYAVP